MLLDRGESLEGVVGLFSDMILFCMFLHCSLVHSSFAAFVFFLITFLYSSPTSVLAYFLLFQLPSLVAQI